ncbi:MAG: hypothetical protein JXQ73_05785 [Phycisphaerae bacterium]|nr:hypothetical protein [Phycisphaerae bacterium]
MNRLRRRLIKVLMAAVTGGIATAPSSCGGAGDGVGETLFLAFRIVDVWA